MLEMELKVRLRDKSRVQMELLKNGCQWSEPQVQEDAIYIKKNCEKTVHIPVFRIRKEGTRTIVTLKVQKADLNTAKELELEISDDKTMHQMLQTIGFEKYVEMKKSRIETTYRGYTICIDEVERLGAFLEIEKIGTENDDCDREYTKMKSVLEELGIYTEDLVTKKYFELIAALDE